MKRRVKRTERGWIGHLRVADKCWFRRNTLLECKSMSTNIVVSTVGQMRDNKNDVIELVPGRYYETMAFKADYDKYKDANVQKPVRFESPWMVKVLDGDLLANDTHENVVDEITRKLMNGEEIEYY